MLQLGYVSIKYNPTRLYNLSSFSFPPLFFLVHRHANYRQHIYCHWRVSEYKSGLVATMANGWNEHYSASGLGEATVKEIVKRGGNVAVCVYFKYNRAYVNNISL